MIRFLQNLWQRPGVRGSLVALSVYTLVTMVITYPVPFRLGSVIAGEEYRDAYQYTWSLWWARHAVFEPGKGLAHLTWMNHPVGIEHPFMLTMAGVSLVALPFSLVLSPAATYNCQILLSFILSGLTMYWLCTELTGDRRAALVGGFIFAFFLNKTGHVLGGHLPQVTVYWFPLYVLSLWRALRRPDWHSGLLAALALIPALLIHVMHIAYFLMPVTLAVLTVKWIEMGRGFFTWRRVGVLALIVGVAALVTAPFLLPTVLHSSEDSAYLYEEGTVEHATDLLAFFTPSRYHPVLGPLGLLPTFAEQVFNNERTLREGLAYPGILAVGLAVLGLVRRRRTAWVWAVLALLAAMLSLGPLLKVGKELVTYEVDARSSYVVLPYALIKLLPLLEIGRTPGRLNEVTMFAVALLAAYGTAALCARLTQRRWVLTILLAFLLVGIGFEYLAIWPLPVGTAEIPPVIQSIAAEPGDGALLHLPMKRRRVNHRALYYQTIVQRPIVGGEVHRSPPGVISWTEMLLGLAQPDQAAGDVVPRPDMADRIAWLRHFDVDYLVFHKLEFDKLAAGADAVYRDFAQELLGPPRYEDSSLAAFSVPVDVPAPSESRLYVMSEQGWYPPEQDGGVWRRWMREDGWLYVYTIRESVGSLRFTVDSHLNAPVLEVYLEDQLLDAVIVGDRATYTTRLFTLKQGMNVFRFHAPIGCPDVLDDPHCWDDALLEPPLGDVAYPCDMPVTCRTFVFDGVSFASQDDLPVGTGLDVNFGDQVRLRGWELDEMALHPGDTLTATLSWEATVGLDDLHIVFVHLLASDGSLVAQYDAPVGDGRIPYSEWPPETTFTYAVQIDLPADLSPGDYRLVTGVYLWPDLVRLPILGDAPGGLPDATELGNVRVAP